MNEIDKAQDDEKTYGEYFYMHDAFLRRWKARKGGNENYHLLDTTQEGIRIKIAKETIIRNNVSTTERKRE